MGFVAAVLSVPWALLAARGVFIVPEGPTQAVLVFLPYIVALSWTVDRRRADLWVPLFAATARRLLVAKIVLVAGVLLTGLLLLVSVVSRIQENREFLNVLAPWFLGSLSVTFNSYMAAHWALHPARVLGPVKFLVRPLDGRHIRGLTRSRPTRLRAQRREE